MSERQQPDDTQDIDDAWDTIPTVRVPPPDETATIPVPAEHASNHASAAPPIAAPAQIPLPYIPTTPEEIAKIEANKDKLDLKPGVNFVHRHWDHFTKGLRALLAKEVTPQAKEWAEKIEILNVENKIQPQLSPGQIRLLLQAIPTPIQQISQLTAVDYLPFGDPDNAGKLPVPGFNNEGNFDPNKVEFVPVTEFPRPQDHPTRILVGISTGTKIYPSPIPASIKEDPRAVFMYQIAVFLHEVFHTIDYTRRDKENRGDKRKTVLLETTAIDSDEKDITLQFTLQDWWRDFENLLLKKTEPKPISHYASTYIHKLNRDFADKEPVGFQAAVAEQMAETFVAYLLGIISNKEDWTNFKEESFGNARALIGYQIGERQSANEKWELMHKLCTARMVEAK